MLVVGILPTRVGDLDSTLVSRLGGIFLHLILQVSSSADALQWSYKRVRPSSPKAILGIGCKSSLPLVGVRVFPPSHNKISVVLGFKIFHATSNVLRDQLCLKEN